MQQTVSVRPRPGAKVDSAVVATLKTIHSAHLKRAKKADKIAAAVVVKLQNNSSNIFFGRS